jgi:hypothetical protein
MYCLLYQCAVISVHQYKKDAIKAMSEYVSSIPATYRKGERKLMRIKPINEVSSYEFSFFING